MQVKFRIKYILPLLLIFINCGQKLSAQPNLQEPIKTDTSVTKGVLQNGLTYYIKSNAKPENKVELRLVVKAGSILENDDQQGLAHFMEHMAFNGLKHFPKNELIDVLQKMGVRFGADLNANTSWDRTYYLLPIPTDNPENIKTGFQILQDWASGALISTNEVNDERKVILEELRMRNKNAQTRMSDKFIPVLLNNSRYAVRIAGGKDSIVQNADANLIREFYRDWYRPDLMAVIVVGDISTMKAKALVEKYFAGLKNPKTEKQRTIYGVTPYASKKAIIVKDTEATNYGFTFIYPSQKTHPIQTVADYRKQLIAEIFAQCINNKFNHMAQSANPPFVGAGFSVKGSFGSITLQNESPELDLSPVNDLQGSINAAIGELLNISSFGFSAQEVQTVLKRYLPIYESAYKERNSTVSASYTNGYLDNFMKGTPILGIENKYNYVKELIPTITKDDINAYAKKILKAPETYFTMATGPSNGKIALPTKEKLIKMVDAAFKQTPVKNEEKETASTLLEKEPKPGKVISQTSDKELGTTTYTLSNGVNVTIKSTDFHKDQIKFSGIKNGGIGLYGIKDKATASFLPSIIGTMGYGQFTPLALSDYLSGKNVNVNVNMTPISDVVNGSSNVKDLETLLELTYLKLTQPRKDTSLLKGWYKKLASSLPLLLSKPENAFKDTLFKSLYGNNPLSPIVVPTQQDVDQIDVERAIDIYKDQFSNADGFHFFLVGNVNKDSVKPLLEKYLGGLPVKGTNPTFKDNGLRMVPGTKKFNFYHGSDDKSIILSIYHGKVNYSPDLKLKADILSQIMTNNVLKIIREKMQAIYSGSVTSSVDKLPYEHYTIIAQMPCGPENVVRIFKELDREVANYRTNGVDQTDLDKIKKAMIEKHKEQLKENTLWSSELEQILFWNTNKEDFLNYEQRVKSITVEDIKQTAVQLLGNNQFKAASFPGKK